MLRRGLLIVLLALLPGLAWADHGPAHPTAIEAARETARCLSHPDPASRTDPDLPTSYFRSVGNNDLAYIVEGEWPVAAVWSSDQARFGERPTVVYRLIPLEDGEYTRSSRGGMLRRQWLRECFEATSAG